MFRSVAITLTLCLATVTAHAALLSRVGGQAYYDDVLNITWLADANLAHTNDFGVAGINVNDGSMQWTTALSWIGAMNMANYLGTSTWRLPTIIDNSTPGCDFYWSGTDCGFNVDLSTSEMAHMYHSTLGNVSFYTTSGVSVYNTSDCSGSSPWCLKNTGPFSNLGPHIYWSGTTYAPIPSRAWGFYFDGGRQGTPDKVEGYYAWAVSTGDTLAPVPVPVPVPSAVWFFGSALGLMGWMRRQVTG